ncbi:MAG: hypothetical protein P8X96_17995 [Desulfobacteraceae bacterium]
MAKIIPLSVYRDQTAIRDGFQLWRTLFDEPFDGETRLSDLKPKTLGYLADPGDRSTAALHALIIGCCGHGASTPFEALDSTVQSRIIDIFLFLSDQIRFEMMLRLGWVDRYWGNRHPLFKMVTAFEQIREGCHNHWPTLAKNHCEYGRYADLIERDQQVFIRRMFPSALTAFKLRFRLK